VSYGTILVPLDGSELAETALYYVELIPSQSVRLLCVEPVELSAARARWARGETLPDGSTWLVSTPAEYLDLIGRRFRDQDRQTESVVVPGEPGPTIVEAAKTTDLIVMATRGHGASRLHLGTTADYVVRHAPVPALVLRASTASEQPAILRVVVLLDGSALAEEALPLARTYARALGVPLHLLRAVDPATSLATEATLVSEASAYLASQEHQLASDVPVTREVRSGTLPDSVVSAIRLGDLVVMTTRGTGATRQLLGSVTEAVLDQTVVPVVLVSAARGAMTRALAGAERESGVTT
jgi:nucleotide-binding universal stress UspA family protein